uniref:Poly(A) polymerase n=1 Tax=Panagrolaimus sp. PS1159 TaxID=55785 RepID=A0AC35G5B4_9BILA
MIRRAKLSRINQLRCLNERYVYKIREPSSSELNYNLGESEYVKKILNNYSKEVQYLNSILKDFENHRQERSIKLTNERKEFIKLFQEKICTANSKLIPVGSSATGLLFDQEFIKLFQEKICTANSKLIPVGSSATGLLYDQGADIDLCLYTEDLEFYKDFQKHKSLRIYIFNKMRHLVYELKDIDPEFQVVESLSLVDLHVPIQIFTFKKDKRLSQVYLFIKKLFEALGLRNSKGGLLSSYHLMMLTIHFLQCRSMSKPVLPVLCSTIPHRVGPDVPAGTVVKLIDGEFGDYKLDWKSKNTQTPAELIFEMINYYRNFFDVNSHQIYINRGIAIKRVQNKNISPSLQIYDPYSPLSICKSPLISDAFSTGIRYIFRSMSFGKLIDSFPHFKEAKGFDKVIEDKPWSFKVKCR